MNLKIIKFGGTSINNDENKKNALKRIKSLKYDKLIIVISAMGRFNEAYATDTLASLALNCSNQEKALILSCGEIISAVCFSNFLIKNQLKSYALNIDESGIKTTSEHLNAKIVDINLEIIKKKLESYDILVIPGFIGKNSKNEITTLNRNGSNLTLIYLAQYLMLKEVIIYTNVEGIYTSNEIFSNQEMIRQISYQEMTKLIAKGKNIISQEVIEIAEKNAISIYVRSTFSYGKGTLITK